ncbi:MAG: isoamylase early set domain-containing protein [Gemmatimonadales bacterium]
MIDSERDPSVIRAIDELRRLPGVDRAAVERVVAAAAALRVTPPGDEPFDVRAPRPRLRRLAGLAGLAAAAAIVGFVIHGFVPAAPVVRTSPAATSGPATGVAMNVSVPDGAALPIAHQFVLSLKGAKRVSVVGDFNEWNQVSAPMTRSADGTLWSATIPILPGRHMYGYLVDDSVFVLDPSEPKVRDPDFGAEGSVVIVGRP